MELFHFKRQRKLSLRFLAGFLLGVGIQKDTHDSIVDARTALQLFQVSMPESVMKASSGAHACSMKHTMSSSSTAACRHVTDHARSADETHGAACVLRVGGLSVREWDCVRCVLTQTGVLCCRCMRS